MFKKNNTIGQEISPFISKEKLSSLVDLNAENLDFFLQKCNNYPPATLALIVQKRDTIPTNAFNNNTVDLTPIEKNREEINKYLDLIYECARKIKHEKNISSNEEAWKAMQNEETRLKQTEENKKVSTSLFVASNTAASSVFSSFNFNLPSQEEKDIEKQKNENFSKELSIKAKPFSPNSGVFSTKDDKPERSFNDNLTKINTAVPITSAFSTNSAFGSKSTNSLETKTGANSETSNKFFFGFGTNPAPSGDASAVKNVSATNQLTFNFGKEVTTPIANFGLNFENKALSPAGGVDKGVSEGRKGSGSDGDKKKEGLKEPKYASPRYPTCSMMEMPNFWEAEVVKKAALFNRNNGFIEKNVNLLRPRLLKWYEKAGTFYQGQQIKYVPIAAEDRDDEVTRVILKDAQRTFFGEEHQEKFAEFLNSMYFELNRSYGQAMSYLAGVCLLGLNQEETAAVLRKVGKEYIPGHWAAEAIGFASNAWVFDYILEKADPEIHQHFKALNFWPDTYLQKILSGLCVHVLPFSLLFDFLDSFMDEGLPFLFKFAMSIIRHFRPEILAVRDIGSIGDLFNIMRLDSNTVDVSDMKTILSYAQRNGNVLGLSEGNTNNVIELVGQFSDRIPELRSLMYERNVAPRLAKAPKTEAFEPCKRCEVNKPKWYSDSKGIVVCDNCKAEAKEVNDWEPF